MTDPRIAVLSALSSPGWHPVPEAHGMPWDEAEQLLAAYDASRAAAVPSAPADRAALHNLIAAALASKFTRDGDVNQGMRVLDDADDSDASAVRRVRPLEAADVVVAVLPAPADRTAAELSDTERQFLTFALDQAAEEMSLGDGFTDEDRAALEKLRRMADEAPANIQCPDAFWTKQPHAPHDWQQRPDAPPVHCPGMNGEAADPSRMAGEAQQGAGACPDCGHLSCDGNGPCGAITKVNVDTEGRCACTRRVAGEAQQPETPTFVCKCPAEICHCGHHAAVSQPGKEATQ